MAESDFAVLLYFDFSKDTTKKKKKKTQKTKKQNKHSSFYNSFYVVGWVHQGQLGIPWT